MSVTPKQLEIMINFIDEHPEMVKNYIPKTNEGRQVLNNLWEDLVLILNAAGLPNKSVTSWRKVWTDFKYRVKRKCSNNLAVNKKNGGKVRISKLEEKAIQMASLRVSNAGSSSACFGAEPEPDIVVVDDEQDTIKESPLDVVEDSGKRTASSLTGCAPKQTRMSYNECKFEKLRILKEQVEMNKVFQMEMLTIFTERNRQDAEFYRHVVQLLEKSNEIAEKHRENKN